MRAIAFYLPQYHAIPENSAIYGKGFTEWDNVRAARPQFPGHWQPHVPHADFGFYSLLDERFLEFQHNFAWNNGVQAFCYYYYNFGGRPLLEKPLELINRNREIQNSFCFCWDHNSWRNNRDGARAVFLRQEYSRAAAARTFEDLCRYFENDRYIKIAGKPFLAIFAPERHPQMSLYADIWRKMAVRRGYPGLWLAGVEAFAGRHPRNFGFDSMIEFAPSWHEDALLSRPGAPLRVFDYPAIARSMAARDMPGYIRSRCVFPGWDNTPRRGALAALAVNNTPEMYRLWLAYAVKYTRAFLPAGLQYVFINAWNEWGEGCHLEPDAKNGYALIQATREVMAGSCRAG